MKEKRQNERLELEKQHFELKCKKLALKEKVKEDEYQLKLKDMEKSERLEKLRMELDFKMQLELAKLKFQSNN